MAKGNTANNNRSNALNPNNAANRASVNNRANQLNPNNTKTKGK